MTVPRRTIHPVKLQERLALFLECGPDALVIVNKSGSIIHVNYQTEKAFGYTREELKGRSIDILLPEHLRERHRRHRSEYLAAPRVRSMGIGLEFCARRKDGSTFPTEITLSPIEIGNESFIISSIRDVTERKTVEHKLAALETRLRRAMAMALCAVWTCKPSGNYACTFVSDNVLEVLGYEPQYFLQDADFWGDHVHPDDLAGALSQFALVDQGQRSFEYRFLQRDGTYRWVHDEIQLISNENGNPIEIVRSSIDITDRKSTEEALLASSITQTENITKRKQAEHALEDSARQLSAIFEGALDAVVVVDDSCRCLEANPAAGELFGLPREQLAGRKITDFAEPGHEDVCRKFLTSGKTRGRWNLVRLDGRRRMIDASVTANVLPGRHLAILRDMTEQQELEDRLRQAQKMEIVTQFAGGMAHDFNNILSGILGNVELLLKKIKRDTKTRKMLEMILHVALQGRSLTQQLLANSRRQAAQLVPVDLNATVRELVEMLRHLVAENIEIATVLEENLGTVEGDPESMMQIIMNLVLNARDAMPRGGRITIETRTVHIAPADHLPSTSEGTYVMLSVSDTGTGMDEATRAKIFEPFFTTKPPGKGTGLGLCTVLSVVQRHGGHIAVDSKPGKGTAVRIYLPCSAETAATAPAKDLQDNLATRLETILVVEDNELAREVTVQFLAQRGYRVLAARDGSEALAISKRHRGEIHLLLTDVVMPGMSGPELAQKLARSCPRMKILYMTGYSDVQKFTEGKLNKETALVLKPFLQNELMGKVREVLGPALSSSQSCPLPD